MAAVTIRALKAGQPYGRAPVRVWLSDSSGALVVGYVNGVLVAALEKPADGAGLATFDLPPNSTVAPANTYYAATVGGVGIGVIEVTGAGEWEDLLVETPEPYDGSALAIHAALRNPHQTRVEDLVDVDLTGLDDDDRLAWDDGAGEWVPRPPAAVGAHHETHETGGDDPVDLSDQFDPLGAAAAVAAALVTEASTRATADTTEATARANADALLIPLTQKGANSGVAELDSGGKVPSAQLPSFVDDVVEAANFAALPATGETGKIYVTLDDGKTYRWSGSAYAEISASLALGETSTTAYRGDRGKTAYDHSQLVSGNPHAVTKSDVGLGNVTNTSDANKPVSTAQQTALDLKADLAGPAFTGNPTAPTQAQGNSSTRLATTAYVQTEAGLLIPKSIGTAQGDLIYFTASGTPTVLPKGTGLQFLRMNSGATAPEWATDTDTIEFVIGSIGTALTTGVKGYLEIPFACTINRSTLLADQSGSVVVNVWKDTYANYPPVVGDKITASAPPTISSATKSQDSTLTGWTTSITAGDVLAFNVDSVTSIQQVTISLRVTK